MEDGKIKVAGESDMPPPPSNEYKIAGDNDMPPPPTDELRASPKPPAPSKTGGESGAFVKPITPSTPTLPSGGLKSESWKETAKPVFGGVEAKPVGNVKTDKPITASQTKGAERTVPISEETFKRMQAKGENVFEKDGNFYQTKSNIPKIQESYAPTTQQNISKIEGMTMQIKFPEYLNLEKKSNTQNEAFDFKKASAEAVSQEQKAEKEQTLKRREERRVQNLPTEIEKLRQERADLLLDKSPEAKKKVLANEFVTKKLQKEVDNLNKSKYENLQNLNQNAIKGIDLEINEYLQEDPKLKDKIKAVGLTDNELWDLSQRAIAKKTAPLLQDLQIFKNEGTIENASSMIKLSDDLRGKQEKMNKISDEMRSYETEYLNKTGFSGLNKEISASKQKLDYYEPYLKKAKAEANIHKKELDELKKRADSFSTLVKDNTWLGTEAQLEELKAIEKEYDNTVQDFNKVYQSESLLGYDEALTNYNNLINTKNNLVSGLKSPEYQKMADNLNGLKLEYDFVYKDYEKFQDPKIKGRINEYFSTVQKVNEYDEKLKTTKGQLTSVEELEKAQEKFNKSGLGGDLLDVGGRAINSIIAASKSLIASPFSIAASFSDLAGTGRGTYHYSDWIADLILGTGSNKLFLTKQTNNFYDAKTDSINWGFFPTLGALADQAGIILTLAVTGKYSLPIVEQRMVTAGMDLTAVAEASKAAEFATTVVPAFMISYGENYNQALKKGFSVEGAIAYSSGLSLLEGLTERILPDQDLIFGKAAKDQLLSGFIKDFSKGKKFAIANLAKKFVYNAGGEQVEENIAMLGEVAATVAGNLTNENIEIEIPKINQIISTNVTSAISGGGMGLIGSISEQSQMYKMGVISLANDFETGKGLLDVYKEKGKIDEKRYNKLISDAQNFQSVRGQIPQGLSGFKTMAIFEKMMAIKGLSAQMDKDKTNPFNKINAKKISVIQGEIEQIVDDKNFDARAEYELTLESEELNKQLEQKPQEEKTQEEKPVELKKNTSPTNEKYGTVNRNDGKGIVNLTKEEFEAEQANMQAKAVGTAPVIELTEEQVANNEYISNAIDEAKNMLQKDILSEEEYIKETEGKKGRFRKGLDKLFGNGNYDEYLIQQKNRLNLLNKNPLAYYESMLAFQTKWNKQNPEDASEYNIGWYEDIIDRIKQQKATPEAIAGETIKQTTNEEANEDGEQKRGKDGEENVTEILQNEGEDGGQKVDLKEKQVLGTEGAVTAAPIENPKVVIQGTRQGLETFESSNYDSKADGRVTDARGLKFDENGVSVQKDNKGNQVVHIAVDAVDVFGRAGKLQVSVIVPEGTNVNTKSIKEIVDAKVAEIKAKGNEELKLGKVQQSDFAALKDAVVNELKNPSVAKSKAEVAPNVEAGSVVEGGITKESDVVKIIDDEYIYHGTKDKNIESIAKEGLKVGTRWHTNGKIFFSPSEKISSIYGNILRIKKSAISDLKKADRSTKVDVGDVFETRIAIKPSDIEIKTESGWKPLQEAPKAEQTPPALRDVESTAKALEGVRLSDIDNILGGEGNKNIPLSEVVENKNDKSLEDVIRKVKIGIGSRTKGPIVVRLKSDGKFHILDGHHRVAEAILRGDETINADVEFEVNTKKMLSEFYHKAKSDGSNPELVNAVEELLKPTTNETVKETAKETSTEGSVLEEPRDGGTQDEGGQESTELRTEEEVAPTQAGEVKGNGKVGGYNPKFKSAKKIQGEETTIEMPDGETREAEYIVVESDDILASHNEVAFSDTEGFPKTADGRNANSRNYKGDNSAQLKVNDDARNLKSSIVISDTATTDGGVPIISTDGIVISGNGRTMAIKLSQKIAPEKYAAYKADLLKRAVKFGIDPKEIANMKNPVLVKIDKNVKDYSVKTFDDYNGKYQKEESPTDKAIKRSSIIKADKALKGKILDIVGRHETMSDLFENRQDRKELFNLLVTNNIILKQETPKYLTDKGEFTPEGKDIVNDILIATILNPKTLEATNSVKAFRNKIINSLPVLSANYKLGDNSLEQNINDAVLLQSKIASMGSQEEFWTHLGQIGMFDVVDPDVVVINRMINNGADKFKKFIVAYNKSMEIDEESNLFGGDEVFTKQQVIDNLKQSNLNENERKVIANLEELYAANEQKRPSGNVEVVGGDEAKQETPKAEQPKQAKPTEKLTDPKNASDLAKIYRNKFGFTPQRSVWAARLFDAKAAFMSKILGISKEDYYKQYWFGVNEGEQEGGLSQLIEQSKENNISLGVKGKGFLNAEQIKSLTKEIESNYANNTNELFGRKKDDIRTKMFNYDTPVASKTINGVDLRIAQGLTRNNKATYLLYADGGIIGEFDSVADAKAAVKFVEDRLIKNKQLFQESKGGLSQMTLPDGRKVTVKTVSAEVVNGFYSNTENALGQVKQEKMSGNQWATQLLSRGANKEEMTWTGLEAFLKENAAKSISKSDIQQFLKNNRIEIKEIVKEDNQEEKINKYKENALKKGREAGFLIDFGTEDEIFISIPNEGSISYDEVRYDTDRSYSAEAYGVSESSLEVAKELFEENNKITFSNAPQSDVKFRDYQLEGRKENYKEVLVTLPNREGKNPLHSKRDELSKKQREAFNSGNYELANEIDNEISKITKQLISEKSINATGEKAKFQSTHFDEPNILVHLRMNTRTDADGNKVLFLEEVQSDFNASYRKSQDMMLDYVNKNENEVIELYKKSGKLAVKC